MALLFYIRHTIVSWYYVYPPVSVHPSVSASSPDNSSYSVHRIALKLGGQLNHEVVQRILIRGYAAQNFDRVIRLFRNDFVSG